MTTSLWPLIAVIVCRDLLALNVYLAMCYHKLDYYDVSQVSDVVTAAAVSSSHTSFAGSVIGLCTTSCR